MEQSTLEQMLYWTGQAMPQSWSLRREQGQNTLAQTLQCST